MDRDLLHIPVDHVAHHTQRARIWRPQNTTPEVWESSIDDLIMRVENQLDFRLTCLLHVVVYSTNKEARRHLDRAVPPDMLLTPVQHPEDSVIAVQSAATHHSNADVTRMRRHLCHELGHVFVALRTGSTKRLGDGDVGMRLSSWVNEGFAVCLGAVVADDLGPIDRALAREEKSLSVPADLDATLNDINSDQRSAAFAISTARVWRAIQSRGLREGFENLTALHASA